MSTTKILLIEDAKEQQEVFKDSVTVFNDKNDLNVEYEIAEDISSALNKIDGSYDGAIIDLKLGNDKDGGNKIVRQLSNSFPKIPIIFVTAFVDLVIDHPSIIKTRRRDDGTYESDLLLFHREKAYQRIQARIAKGQLLRDRQISSDEELKEAEADFNNWSEHNEIILSLLFGNSLTVDEYKKLHHDAAPRPSYDSQSLIHQHPTLQHHIHQGYVYQHQKQVTMHIRCLEKIRDQLEFPDEPAYASPNPFGDDVFIVHGHDEEVKYAVASFIRRLDLTATILHEQPCIGTTFIEKFEKYANNVGFAIILLTPDDIDNKVEHQSRARQNVIFELGYFIGKLGRERVFPLFKGKIDIPSDLAGIVYVSMDSTDNWKLKLAQGMKNAGLPIDMNKLL